MKKLVNFLSEVSEHIDQKGFDDVLDLIPYYEELQLPDWPAMLQKQNGKPVNTTIFQSDRIRLVIIYWDARQESSIHGHAEGGGLIKVLAGQLEETRFDPVDRQVIGKFVYRPGAMTYINDMIALHQVKNPGQDPAFSLHMYTRRS